jgi:hypothetical protein
VFRDLPTIVSLPPDRVLFTVDGFRYPDAEAEGKGTYFDLMRRAFISKAAPLGYEVIDLDPRSNTMQRMRRDVTARPAEE